MLFGKSKDVIGLDIGSSCVKVIQLKEGKHGYSLVNFGMIALPPETIVDNAIMNSAAVVEVIKELLNSTKIKEKNVVMGLSGHSVIIKKITLPSMSQEQLEEAIHWEAEQYIPFDINDVNMDVTIINPHSTVAGQMDVLLVAAKKEMVQDYVSIAAEAGLVPVVIDVDVFALQNMFEINYEMVPGETIVLCNVGAANTNLNIINNGISLFTRDLTVGGNMITEEIMKGLNVSFEEAEALKVGGQTTADGDSVIPQEVDKIIQSVSDMIVNEIQRSIDFYTATTADSSISRIYLCGGCAKIASILRILEARLNIPVELINPFRNIEIDERRFDTEYIQNIAPLASIAVGLGIRRPNDK
ncbi:MAG: pilus assembly protein PilM [Deltaproteobacteria bacterium]|nr:pilus assembly protein PilM [Deltaproteobacteria bacterium]